MAATQEALYGRLDLSLSWSEAELPERVRTKRVHRLHPYLGKFVPQLVRALLERYVAAFEAYDLDRLTDLLREDTVMSMPPYSLWVQGRDDVFSFFYGPGIGCKGSRVLPAGTANGSPAYGQYKPAAGGGYEPWALQVVELRKGKVGEITFFLDTDRVFPLFGLPPRLEAAA